MSFYGFDPVRIVDRYLPERIAGKRVHGTEVRNQVGNHLALFHARPVLVFAFGDRLIRRPRQVVHITQHTRHRAGREVPEGNDSVDAAFEPVQPGFGLGQKILELDDACRGRDNLVVIEQTSEFTRFRLSNGRQLHSIEVIEANYEYIPHSEPSP